MATLTKLWRPNEVSGTDYGRSSSNMAQSPSIPTCRAAPLSIISIHGSIKKHNEGFYSFCFVFFSFLFFSGFTFSRWETNEHVVGYGAGVRGRLVQVRLKWEPSSIQWEGQGQSLR